MRGMRKKFNNAVAKKLRKESGAAVTHKEYRRAAMGVAGGMAKAGVARGLRKAGQAISGARKRPGLIAKKPGGRTAVRPGRSAGKRPMQPKRPNRGPGKTRRPSRPGRVVNVPPRRGPRKIYRRPL